MNLFRVFERRDLWGIHLYRFDADREVFSISSHQPFFHIGENGIRSNDKYQSTVADPFLYVHCDKLYVFYEIKTDFGYGEIWAKSSKDLSIWQCHGQVLKETYHLSYPQVFSTDGRIFMIPEASASGKVFLYESEVFPNKWRKTVALVKEPLRDSTVICRPDGFFLLGTNQDYELRLYHSPVLDQEFSFTGIVISRDRMNSRNAGCLFVVDDVLFRPAQDCKYSYGRAVGVWRVDQISKVEYREVLYMPKLLSSIPSWASEGYHHLSMTSFNGKTIIAVDGFRRDTYRNTLSLALLKARSFLGFA